jgi:hypothetical protein
MSPPQVRLLTTVKREHVFGDWYQSISFHLTSRICLDMLQSWSGFKDQKYTGWSTAYTTLSILLQLQGKNNNQDHLINKSAFIFESEHTASTGGIFAACKNAAAYICKTCPHNMLKFSPWPWRSHMQKPLTQTETVNKSLTNPTKSHFRMRDSNLPNSLALTKMNKKFNK